MGESHKLLVPGSGDDRNFLTIAERKVIARAHTIAIAYIIGGDTSRYGTLIKELGNRYARGKDEYSSDLYDAYSALVDYATLVNTEGRAWSGGVTTAPSAAPAASAVTFVQQAVVPDTDGNTFSTVTCFQYSSLGHYADRCPSDITSMTTSSTGTTLLQHTYVLAQSKESGIDHEWILLDSQSTISVFKNKEILTNVRRSPHVLCAITNGGHQDSNMVGNFPNLGKVW